jgi:hypothetical protein
MEKTLAWIFGILAILAIGGTVVFMILWNKEKKKNAPKGTKAATGTTNGGGTATPSADPNATSSTANATQDGNSTVARFSN